jgi:hypothetical protein
MTNPDPDMPPAPAAVQPRQLDKEPTTEEVPGKGQPPNCVFTCFRCNITKPMKAWIIPASMCCASCHGTLAPRFFDDEGSHL